MCCPAFLALVSPEAITHNWPRRIGEPTRNGVCLSWFRLEVKRIRNWWTGNRYSVAVR